MRNSGVIGRVHHETMNKLFQIGFFPNVKDMQQQLEDFRDYLITHHHNIDVIEYEKLPFWKKWFIEYPTIPKGKHFTLLVGKNLGVAFNQLGYPILADAAFALNDINKVLEIIRVAKRTGSNVYCNDKELETIDIVINNSEYYLELDKIIEEEISDVMEELE